MWQGGYRGTCSSCAMRLKSVRLVTLRTETDDGLVWCLIRISLRVFTLVQSFGATMHVSHASLRERHILVRLPSPCRSCNTKLQSRARHDLPTNSRLFSLGFDLELFTLTSAAFRLFLASNLAYFWLYSAKLKFWSRTARQASASLKNILELRQLSSYDYVINTIRCVSFRPLKYI